LLQELAHMHMHKLNNNNNNYYYYYFVQDLVHPVAPNPTDVTFLQAAAHAQEVRWEHHVCARPGSFYTLDLGLGMNLVILNPQASHDSRGVIASGADENDAEPTKLGCE
jgi:hypothetical protein